MQKLRVYIACSLDGFIAGPGDDLSWLPDPSSIESSGAESSGAGPASDERDTVSDPGAMSFDAFIADIGALLMGRRTYDVVTGFEAASPYGSLPVLVPTHRPLSPSSATVRAIEGDIISLVAMAKEAAGGKDVYIDGGSLIRQALDQNLIDEIVLSLVPVVLGSGHSLFAGVKQRHKFQLVAHYNLAPGMVQLHLRANRPQS